MNNFKDAQIVAQCDLVIADARHMTERLDKLDSLIGTKTGSFDLQRAFLKEIMRLMREKRDPLLTAIRQRESVEA